MPSAVEVCYMLNNHKGSEDRRTRNDTSVPFSWYGEEFSSIKPIVASLDALARNDRSCKEKRTTSIDDFLFEML